MKIEVLTLQVHKKKEKSSSYSYSYHVNTGCMNQILLKHHRVENRSPRMKDEPVLNQQLVQNRSPRAKAEPVLNHLMLAPKTISNGSSALITLIKITNYRQVFYKTNHHERIVANNNELRNITKFNHNVTHRYVGHKLNS